jgi:hypothetical protein
MESIRSFSIFDFRLPIDRKRVASGTAKETTEHNQQSKIENPQCLNASIGNRKSATPSSIRNLAPRG